MHQSCLRPAFIADSEAASGDVQSYLMANESLVKLGPLFTRMYEADAKGGRPGIVPEKLLAQC